MLYQVNAKGLQPYYTDGYIDAMNIYANLKYAGVRCSLRRIPLRKFLVKMGVRR